MCLSIKWPCSEIINVKRFCIFFEIFVRICGKNHVKKHVSVTGHPDLLSFLSQIWTTQQMYSKSL